MIFELNDHLLIEARAILYDRDDIYWIIGGAGSGKSTISRILSERYSIPIYDMDEYVFGHYMARYNVDRHPASFAWFKVSNPLDWVLSLSWEQFDSLYKAANAEYLSLLAEDYGNEEIRGPQIIDGGITHPSVLARAVNPSQVICLAAPQDIAGEIWDSSDERLAMKRQVIALDDGSVKWAKFLEFDKLMTKTIIGESRQVNIEILYRETNTTAQVYASQAAENLGIAL